MKQHDKVRTPPAQEIAELTQRLIDEGCEGDGQHCTADDALIPFDQWCLNCLAGRALQALTAETQARQEAEADAIGSRDELNILKVKHASDVLARQQAEREQDKILFLIEAMWEAAKGNEVSDFALSHVPVQWIADNRKELALSEQARAQAEQNLRSTLKDLAGTDWQRVKAEQARARLRKALEKIDATLFGWHTDNPEDVQMVVVRIVHDALFPILRPQATTTDETLRAALVELQSAAWSRSWKRVKAARAAVEALTGFSVPGPLVHSLESAP